MKKKVTSSSDIKNILKLRKEGSTQAEIVKVTGWSIVTVRRILLENGLCSIKDRDAKTKFKEVYKTRAKRNLKEEITNMKGFDRIFDRIGTISNLQLYKEEIQGKLNCSYSNFNKAANELCEEHGFMTFKEARKLKREEDIEENKFLTAERKKEQRKLFLKRVGRVIKDYNDGIDPVEVANRNGYSYMSMNFLLAKVRACNKGKLDIPYRYKMVKTFAREKIGKYQARSCTFTPEEINIIRQA